MERIGSIAYRLDLPPDLEQIHNVFHVSMLRKYIFDPSHVLEASPIKLNEDLSIEMQPVGIVNQKLKELRNKEIPMVKVLWISNTIKKMVCETDVSMRDRYMYLFNT